MQSIRNVITAAIAALLMAMPVQSLAGRWTWEGGIPVVVGSGDNIETISRKYGVPASAIMHSNGITDPSSIRPGHRLVIPRYVASDAGVETESPVDQDKAEKTKQSGEAPSFCWPVHGRIISAFGSRTSGAQNDGINVAVPEGTPVKAAKDGIVAYSGKLTSADLAAFKRRRYQ
jgi:murein DD-endopeptidase MepM/ murein hydrolase activator NlpD